jgi:hypothetical protein
MMAFDMTLTLVSSTAQMIFYIVGILAFIKYLFKR